MTPCNRVLLTAAGVYSLMTGSALADTSDTDRVAELERKLERSMQMIEALSAKVRQLEESRAASAVPVPAATEQRLDMLENQVVQLGNGLSLRPDDEGGLPIHGFADVSLVHGGENNAVYGKGTKGFTIGNLDLYLTPRFGDRVRSLVELVFEVERDGSVHSELERAQIGYSFSDAATLWAGRFHTPYGYWNTAFHHGAQIQTSISRPRFIEFEEMGGILPAHTTGAWLSGALNDEGARYGYDIYLGNAPTLRLDPTVTTNNVARSNPGAFSPTLSTGGYAGTGTLDMNQGGRSSHGYSSGFNAWVAPHSIEGLRVGLHGLRANVEDDSTDMNRTGLRMLGGYLSYNGRRWEVLGEHFGFRNRDLSGGTGSHRSRAGYLQAGYSFGQMTPFARVERAGLAQADNYFGVHVYGRSYSRIAAGMRFDLNPLAALKFELTRTQQEDLGPGLDNNYNEARLQYSVRF